MKRFPALIVSALLLPGLAACAGSAAAPEPSIEEHWDLIPMVMIDGELYLTTGYKSTAEGRCGVPDGEITSSVPGDQRPTEDDQSNFGTGCPYRFGAVEGTVEVYNHGGWELYATDEVRDELWDALKDGQ